MSTGKPQHWGNGKMGNRGAGKPWEPENREDKVGAATAKREPREGGNREHRGTGTTEELGSHRTGEKGNQGTRESREPVSGRHGKTGGNGKGLTVGTGELQH